MYQTRATHITVLRERSAFQYGPSNARHYHHLSTYTSHSDWTVAHAIRHASGPRCHNALGWSDNLAIQAVGGAFQSRYDISTLSILIVRRTHFESVGSLATTQL